VAPGLAAFVAGVLLLQQFSALPSRGAVAILAAAGAALVLVALLRHAPLLRRVVLLAAAAIAGFLYADLRAQLQLNDELAFADEGRDVRVIGVIETLPSEFDRALRFEFEVERVPDAPFHVPQRLSLSWNEPPPALRPAQRWDLVVRLRRPHATLNPAGLDVEGYLFERDLRATGAVRGNDARAPRLVDDIVWQPLALVDRGRQALRTRLREVLGDRRYAPVLIALVMGDQGAVSPDDWSLFNKTGIGHLVSISGTHITMIAGLGALVAGAAWRRSRRLLARASVPAVRAVGGALTAFIYCMIAGWGVPAQRTFFMLATFALLVPARRRIGGLATLAFAAAVVCLIDPWCVLSAGFWLSFGAVASILFAMEGRLGRARHWRERLAEAVRVQWTVTAGLVPATIVIFQQISVVSPLANAVAIPVVSLIVTPLALIGAALLWLPPPLDSLATWVLAASHLAFAANAAILQAMVELPYASVAVAAPPAWTLAFALPGLAWLMAPPGWPSRAAGIVGLLPMLGWPPDSPRAGELRVTALDVGQGMALLVESASSVVLFDTGPRIAPGIDAATRVLVPYLRWRGIDRIDLMIVSHLDSDHSGGAASVLAAMPVGAVMTSIEPGNPILARAPHVDRCEAGQRRTAGDLEIEVVQPPAAAYLRKLTTNQRSCVVEIRLGPHRVLLTGDVPSREERALVAAGRVRPAELMVAPHHGSQTSSSDELIAAVAPRWASVQAGYRSRFGHPNRAVLERYAAHGVVVARSDRDGAVQWRFTADGTVELEAWRRDHARYWHNQPAGRLPSPQQGSTTPSEKAEGAEKAAESPDPPTAGDDPGP
jgi:competence protein ComEC